MRDILKKALATIKKVNAVAKFLIVRSTLFSWWLQYNKKWAVISWCFSIINLIPIIIEVAVYLITGGRVLDIALEIKRLASDNVTTSLANKWIGRIGD